MRKVAPPPQALPGPEPTRIRLRSGAVVKLPACPGTRPAGHPGGVACNTPAVHRCLRCGRGFCAHHRERHFVWKDHYGLYLCSGCEE